MYQETSEDQLMHAYGITTPDKAQTDKCPFYDTSQHAHHVHQATIIPGNRIDKATIHTGDPKIESIATRVLLVSTNWTFGWEVRHTSDELARGNELRKEV